MLKKIWLLSLILLLGLSLTACTESPSPTVDNEEQTPIVDEVEKTEAQDGKTSINIGYDDIKLSPIEAYGIYIEKYPNAKVTQVQLDKDLGSYVYKIEGIDNNKEYEISLNPVTGKIIKEDTDREVDNDDNGEITKSHVEKIENLVNMALKDSGEASKVDEWSLEFDDGRIILEVEIDKKGLDDDEYKYDVETETLIEKD